MAGRRMIWEVWEAATYVSIAGKKNTCWSAGNGICEYEQEAIHKKKVRRQQHVSM
jgi:hypothetical protein